MSQKKVAVLLQLLAMMIVQEASSFYVNSVCLQKCIQTCGTNSPVSNPQSPRDCLDALNKGFTTSGVYSVKPDHLAPFDVYCDMDTNGGGWTVFQRRQDGREEFYRGWYFYATGFGNLRSEHWLGLDKLHRLTAGRANTELRVDLEDFVPARRHAQYSSFRVGTAYDKYRLTVSGYEGDAGDSMSGLNGRAFSTHDQDNDTWENNCAVSYKGAWWYAACHHSNLNGKYHRGSHVSFADGVNWQTWRGYHYSLKFTEMKLRALA